MSNGNVYGALLQMRDLYEVTMKVPVIMAIAFMDHYDEDKLLQDDSIIRLIVENPLTMGSWSTLASKVIKNADNYLLPQNLKRILKNTNALYHKKVTDRVPNIVNWRNESIGHGALKFEDSKEYQDEFTNLIKNYRDYCDKCKDAYTTLFFIQGEQPLVGEINPRMLREEKICLKTNNQILSLGNRFDILCQMDGFDDGEFTNHELDYETILSGMIDYLKNANDYSDYSIIYEPMGYLIGAYYHAGAVTVSYRRIVLPLIASIKTLIDCSEGGKCEELRKILYILECVKAFYDYYFEKKIPVIDQLKYELLSVLNAPYYSIFPSVYRFFLDIKNRTMKEIIYYRNIFPFESVIPLEFLNDTIGDLE